MIQISLPSGTGSGDGGADLSEIEEKIGAAETKLTELENGAAATKKEVKEEIDNSKYYDKLIFQSALPGNDVIDGSVMVWIPKFKVFDVLDPKDTNGSHGGSDFTHPAFVDENGNEIDGFWVSKYQNIVGKDGKAYSLPGQTPTTSISLEEARRACKEKGDNWHLISNDQWAAVALWAKKNKSLPRGNNNKGRDIDDTQYKAIPMAKNSDKEIVIVATGTGPVNWTHDKSTAGIWDLNGNIWEWVDGIRLCYGEIQKWENGSWHGLSYANGTWGSMENTPDMSIGENEGSNCRFDWQDSKWKIATNITTESGTSNDCKFASVSTDSSKDKTKNTLRAMALLPDLKFATEYSSNNEHFRLINGDSEQYFYRGGDYDDGRRAGVFALGTGDKSHKSSTLGFRAVYIPPAENNIPIPSPAADIHIRDAEEEIRPSISTSDLSFLL